MPNDESDGNHASSGRRTTMLAGVLLGFVLAVVGCGDIAVVIPEALVTPTLAGVLVRTVPLDEHRETHVLANGVQVEIDGTTARVIGDPGEPDPGDLLLTDESRSWVVWLRPNLIQGAPPGCFRLVGLARDDGAFISFVSGLRLPKAAEFDPGVGGREGLYRIPQSSFCVDETGALTSYH